MRAVIDARRIGFVTADINIASATLTREGQTPMSTIRQRVVFTGQSGRLFLPFDFMIGRTLSPGVAISLEIGLPIVKDYPVYNFKTEAQINMRF